MPFYIRGLSVHLLWYSQGDPGANPSGVPRDDHIHGRIMQFCTFLDSYKADDHVKQACHCEGGAVVFLGRAHPNCLYVMI